MSTRTGSRGFTLIELLVTMALLSLLMLGMASALRTMAQTEERIDARLARADEFRIATGFLRSIVGRVSARTAAGLPWRPRTAAHLSSRASSGPSPLRRPR